MDEISVYKGSVAYSKGQYEAIFSGKEIETEKSLFEKIYSYYAQRNSRGNTNYIQIHYNFEYKSYRVVVFTDMGYDGYDTDEGPTEKTPLDAMISFIKHKNIQ